MTAPVYKNNFLIRTCPRQSKSSQLTSCLFLICGFHSKHISSFFIFKHYLLIYSDRFILFSFTTENSPLKRSSLEIFTLREIKCIIVSKWNAFSKYMLLLLNSKFMNIWFYPLIATFFKLFDYYFDLFF